MLILVPEWHCDLHDTPKTVNPLYCEVSIKGIICSNGICCMWWGSSQYMMIQIEVCVFKLMI